MDETVTPPVKPPRRIATKLLFGLLVVNLAVTGYSTVRKFMETTPSAAATVTVPSSETPVVDDDATRPVESLETMVVNLDEPDGVHYLRITLGLQLVDDDEAADVKRSVPAIRDAVLVQLSGLRVADTRGTQNLEKLRGSLLARIDGVIGKNRVGKVLFHEFVVQ